jgi:hypothetical protein
MRNVLTFLVLVLFLASCKQQNKPGLLTYDQVVYRLTDLRALAKLPEEGEKSGMFSSYDRNSMYDSATHSYQNWDANGDGTGNLRMEGDNEVLVEMEGPGAIVRIWSATPDTGTLSVFIDGKEIPELSIPFKDYFSYDVPLFNYPGLVYQTNARGYNNFVPITFQKSIKIVGEPGWGKYFHFNYVKFPEGMEIESFNSNPGEKSLEALQAVNEFFSAKPGVFPYEDRKQSTKTIKTVVNPGALETMFEINGKYAITSIKARINTDKISRIDEVLRKAAIQIRWDDQEDYAVWSPLGDFFGTAPGINHFQTYVMGMNDSLMYTYWYMPFEKNARIEIFNESAEALEIEFEVTWERLKGEFAGYARFHAKWHKGIAPVEDKNRWPDWTFLKTEGSGRYAGLSLVVWSPRGGHCREFAGPGYWWWGEGDEKLFVDGEKFPSTFGTGTEDYFGYAWCNSNIFSNALHSQSQNNRNMGYQPVNRFHTTDNVPFHTSFEAYLEKYFPDDWPTQYAAVVYWYLDKNGVDPIKPAPVSDRYGFEITKEPYSKPGAIEAETLNVAKNTGGATRSFWPHESLYWDISGSEVRLWNLNGNNPAELILEFESALSGKHQLISAIEIMPVGGTFTVEFNGVPLKNKISTRSTKEREVKIMNLGEVNVQPGKQEIKIIWQGDPNLKRPLVLSMDYFELLPK